MRKSDRVRAIFVDEVMSVCMSAFMSVCLSVIIFLIFPKKGFESGNSNLSNMTKVILLDSLLQEFCHRGNSNSKLSNMPKHILTYIAYLRRDSRERFY